MDFMGYIRPDGSIGTRNHVFIISRGAKTDRITINVANSVANTRPVLCGYTGVHPDDELVVRLAGHPNVAGIIVLEPGPESEIASVENKLRELGKPYAVINLADCGSAVEALAKATRSAVEMVREASTHKRQVTRLSRLVTGLLYVDNESARDVVYHFINGMVSNNSRVVGYQAGRDKIKEIAGYQASGVLARGQKVPKAQGLYVVNGANSPESALMDMLCSGVQVVVSNCGYMLQNSVLPVINMVTDHDTYMQSKDDLEMEIIALTDTYKIEDYSLLVVNEVIATASGKYTKAEILKF